MPELQLMLTHAASYALKRVYSMQFFFSEEMTVITTYHGKAIITRITTRQSNDDKIGVTEEQ